MFKPNLNFPAEIAASGDTYREGLKAAAEPARAMVERFANKVMPRPGAEQIVIEDTGDEVLIVNTDYGAFIDEIGSRNNPPNAPLRRGVRAAGLRLEESQS